MFKLPVQNVEYKADTGYKTIGNDDTAMDILSEALQLGFGRDMTWMDNIELKSVDSYERFNKMVDALNIFQRDTAEVIAYSKSLKNRENLFDTPFEFYSQTYIQSTSGNLVATMSHLLPLVKDSVPEEEYNSFQESLARIMWLRANITRTRSFPSNYKPEELEELQKVVEKFGDLVQGLDSRSPSGVFEGVSVEKKKIPFKFTALIAITQYSMMLGRAFEVSAKVLGNSVARVMDACNGMGDWGDFKTNPIGTLVGVMNSLGQMYIEGGQFYASIIDLGNTGVQALGKNNGKSSLKSLKAMSPKDLTFKALSRVIGMISKLSSGIFSFTTAIISSAFGMFTTILSSSIKIIKSIAETSPVVKAISEYLGLFLSMLFLPFFTAFGDPLLEAMMTTLTAISELGVQFINWLQNADESVKKDLDDILSTLILDIEDILTKFIQDVIANFNELVPPMLDFILLFTQTIIENSELILDLLRAGINAMNDMVEGNILNTVLNMSKSVFDFIYANKGFVKKCVNIMLACIAGGLNVVSTVLSHLKIATVAFCLAVGAVCGASGGFQLGLILAPFTFGTSLLITTTAGAIIGTGAGAVAAYEIIKNWIDPAEKVVNELKYSEVPAFGSGGKIYGRRGGHIGLLGESGQGEYAIPQSKMNLFRGNNNIILRFKKGVYDQKEIESVLRELKTEVQFDYLFE